MEFLANNLAIIMTILFLLSELIGGNDRIRANSVFGTLRLFLLSQSLRARPKIDALMNEKKTQSETFRSE